MRKSSSLSDKNSAHFQRLCQSGVGMAAQYPSSCRQMGERPCLEHHIKRCLAPCTGKVDKDEYRSMIRAVCLFLEGRTEDVERELENHMKEAAEAFQFELAARLRDQLMAVRK